MPAISSIQLDELNESSLRKTSPYLGLARHQEAALSACLDIERGGAVPGSGSPRIETSVGVLGDRPGSGKSLAMLALALEALSRGARDEQVLTSHARDMIHVFRVSTAKDVDASIVFTPLAEANAWVDLARRVHGGPRIAVCHSKAKLASLSDDSFDVLITTFQLSTAVGRRWPHVRWKRAIYDECPPSSNCVRVAARMYWFVKASFRVDDARGRKPLGRCMWNDLLADLSKESPEIVRRIVIKNEDSFVDASLGVPPVVRRLIRCKPSLERDEPHHDSRYAFEVMQSLESGDITDAIALTGASVKSDDEGVIGALAEIVEQKMRNLLIRIDFNRAMAARHGDCEESWHASELIALDTKLTEMERVSRTIRDRVSSADTCPICYELLDVKSVVPCCQSAFCVRCVSRWLVKSDVCAICKARIRLSDMLLVAPPGLGLSEEKTRVDLLGEILSRSGARVVVVAPYDDAFVEIKRKVSDMKIGNGSLTGTSASRVRAIVKEFQDPAGGVALLFTRLGKAAMRLSLTAATDIVVMQKTEKRELDELIGCAHRPGRTVSLRVWHLLCRSPKTSP